MRIRRSKDDFIQIVEIEPVHGELLRQLPSYCDPSGDAKAEERLFSRPADPSEAQINRDWEEFVRPELRHLFLSARRVVEKDLEQLEAVSGPEEQLSIPVAHADAWLNTLNQARLVLAARYDFSEAELSSHEGPENFLQRDVALLQINFYALIQEHIIDALQSR
jgi:Domain of unknown function (DUF2017)